MSIDVATTEGQFIQTLTMFSIWGCQKNCDNLVHAAHQNYKLALTQRGAFRLQ